MAIKNRTELKAYFVKNAIPTEANFADLIDSQVNQAAEGVIKPDRDPFSLVAAPGDQKRVLRLFNAYPAANPDWLISLNPAQNPADPATNRPGFGIADGSGNTRLFVEAGSGRVGIGTNQPSAPLHVNGLARLASGQVDGALTVSAQIIPSVGNAENRGIAFPADPGGGAGDRAFIRYFVEGAAPSETTKLLIGNNNDADDRISLYQMGGERLTVYNGRVGINNVSPAASLDVMSVSATWGTWQEAIRFSHTAHAAITFPASGLLFGMHSDRNFYFADTTGGRYLATISQHNGGALGVGTNGAPSYSLHVKGATNDWLARFENANTTSNVYLAHGGGHGIHVTTSTSSTSQYLLDLINPSIAGARFYVTTAGKLGIGTTVPDHHLHVLGETKTYGITLTASGAWWHRGGTEAGIVNANDAHKALMIVGSDQGQGKGRWVRMWDTVSIEGTLLLQNRYRFDVAGDDWLRLFKPEGGDYYGGFAANKLYCKEFHGSPVIHGDIKITGKLSTMNYEPAGPKPSAWGAGVVTWDVIAYANGFAKGAWHSQQFDVAERFQHHEEGLEPGDIVAVDPEHSERLVKSTSAQEVDLVGVISEQPGFVLGVLWEDPGAGVPLALAGRVPTKVNLEGGPIAIGDYLTSSAVPGVAMRATKPCRVIGMAMAPFDGKGAASGKVVVLVNPHWYGGQ